MPTKYTLSARILHWLMAIIIISTIVIAFYMTAIDKNNENRLFFYNLHKSLGIVVFLLAIVRLIVRLRNAPPPMPKDTSLLIFNLAKTIHSLMYLLIFLVPISGYLMSNYYGYPAKLFGISLPVVATINFDLARFFTQMHEFFAFSLIFLIIIHIVATIRHQLKTPIINRML